jgi:hypothetical protein
MRTIVKAHTTTGLVVTPSTNSPEYGTIRVEQVAFSVTNGFTNKSTRSAFIKGKLSDFADMGLKKDGLFPIEGRILIKESFEPMYEGQKAKLNPSSGEEIKIDGRLVYRDSYFTSDESLSDVLITESSAVAELIANA